MAHPTPAPVASWYEGFGNIHGALRWNTERCPTAGAIVGTIWNALAPDEYGFYSNVNPARPHPRWSQDTERRIGDTLRRATLPFNGYGDQVASLYNGMDLRKFY